MQKAGQRVASAGQSIGTSASESTTGSGQDEPDPLIPESDSTSESDIAGANDGAVGQTSSQQTGPSAPETGQPAASGEAGQSGETGEPVAGGAGTGNEVEAARDALEKAGIALQEAGEAVQNAESQEDLARAEEALSNARVAVIVAGEDLREAQESKGGGDDDQPWQEAGAALEEANHAIITASRTVLSAGAELPERPGGSGTENKKGQLDEELDESLAIFEGKIQDAREDVIDGAPAPPEHKDPTQETVAIGESGGGQQSDSEEDGEESSEDGSEQQQTGRMPGPGEVQTAEAPSQPPEDIPDGQDDDIVAQQLREAAMAETDPELKEKLWEEYRRYKEGISR